MWGIRQAGASGSAVLVVPVVLVVLVVAAAVALAIAVTFAIALAAALPLTMPAAAPFPGLLLAAVSLRLRFGLLTLRLLLVALRPALLLLTLLFLALLLGLRLGLLLLGLAALLLRLRPLLLDPRLGLGALLLLLLLLLVPDTSVGLAALRLGVLLALASLGLLLLLPQAGVGLLAIFRLPALGLLGLDAPLLFACASIGGAGLGLQPLHVILVLTPLGDQPLVLIGLGTLLLRPRLLVRLPVAPIGVLALALRVVTAPAVVRTRGRPGAFPPAGVLHRLAAAPGLLLRRMAPRVERRLPERPAAREIAAGVVGPSFQQVVGQGFTAGVVDRRQPAVVEAVAIGRIAHEERLFLPAMVEVGAWAARRAFQDPDHVALVHPRAWGDAVVVEGPVRRRVPIPVLHRIGPVPVFAGRPRGRAGDDRRRRRLGQGLHGRRIGHLAHELGRRLRRSVMAAAAGDGRGESRRRGGDAQGLSGKSHGELLVAEGAADGQGRPLQLPQDVTVDRPA